MDGTSYRHKFVAIYINPGKYIPVRLRGQVAECKGNIQSFLNGVHVELSSDFFLLDIDEEVIVQKLLASGGAHSPVYLHV